MNMWPSIISTLLKGIYSSPYFNRATLIFDLSSRLEIFTLKSGERVNPNVANYLSGTRFLLSESIWDIILLDSNSIAAAVTDHDIYQWSIPTGRLLRRFRGHGDVVR